MMALHCRSRAGPVRSFLGKRVVPQTRNAQLVLTMLHQRSSRINHQKVVLHRARATLDKIPPRRRSRAPRAHSAVLGFRNRPCAGAWRPTDDEQRRDKLLLRLLKTPPQPRPKRARGKAKPIVKKPKSQVRESG